MRSLARARRLIVLALLFAALGAGLAYGSWIAAQLRAVVVLSTTLETPVLTWVVKHLTDEPRVEDARVAGVPSTVARPGGGEGPWPAIVVVNGATPLGRREPDVEDLARGLARAGHLVVVPDLPGLAAGEITKRTADATVSVALAVARRSDVRDGRVSLLGVSVGASLALLAAEEPTLAGRIRLVAGIAPYADLAEIIRLATTGHFEDDGRLERYEADPFLGIVVGRSLVAALPPGEDRDALLAALPETAEEDAADPLGPLRRRAVAVTDETAQAVVELLANQDPDRFDQLLAALPEELHAGLARLSPLARAGALRARVELASAPEDRYFPVAHSRALVRAARNARLTVTGAFAHAVPAPDLTDPGDVLRFDGWAVRSLRALRR